MSTIARQVRPEDQVAIEALCERGRWTTPPLWPWKAHLTADSFLVTERGDRLTGALFAWPDDSPVAWVRLAVLDDGEKVIRWLDLILAPLLTALRRRGSESLAWMDHWGWMGEHLTTYGFAHLTDVITLIKRDSALPDEQRANARLRPVEPADIPAIVAIERAAFTPHWWNSGTTLARRAAESPQFIVAESNGEILGYAEGEVYALSAHLNRIAVHPAYQGQGIGATLLRHTLRTFWTMGVEQVTLNTQRDNRTSHRLYRRFGFRPLGDTTTGWEYRLWYKEDAYVQRAF